MITYVVDIIGEADKDAAFQSFDSAAGKLKEYLDAGKTVQVHTMEVEDAAEVDALDEGDIHADAEAAQEAPSGEQETELVGDDSAKEPLEVPGINDGTEDADTDADADDEGEGESLSLDELTAPDEDGEDEDAEKTS